MVSAIGSVSSAPTFGARLYRRPANASSMASWAARRSPSVATMATPPKPPASASRAPSAGPADTRCSSIPAIAVPTLLTRSRMLRSTPTTVTRIRGPLKCCPSSAVIPISSGAQNVRSNSSPTELPIVSANCSLTETSSGAAGSGVRPSTMMGTPSMASGSASNITRTLAGHVRLGSETADAVKPT